jgi:uncharacterized protein YbjT (DUF2867 family)
MTTQILVTGGTGTLGRHLVPMLVDAGVNVRVLSRGNHPPVDGVEHVAADLLTGTGIGPAVDGIDTLVHLAGAQKGDDVAAATVARAASRAGVGHLVFVSVTGADRIPIAWLRSKLAAERVIAESGIPWTTIRAAQFHGFVATMLRGMTRLPVVPSPGGLRFEPVDPRDVAVRLADLALGGPAGAVADFAGPIVYGFDELARSYLHSTGRRRRLLPVRMPGKVGRAYRAGDNLARLGADRGTATWEGFLAGQRAGRF